jgi:phosphatidylserine/phosphatidylglycerophosphate/cardiolipin synthase-like enzyme
LIDVIRAAQRELIIVSFAAYKVEVVLRELETAINRGVKVRLILETGAKEGGTLTFGAAGAFDSIRDSVLFYVWPTEKRPELEKGRAALHAKAAIADDHTAFVTSANLTGHAIAENMELGVLIAGGRIPQRLGGHFRQLISDEILEGTK